MTTPHIYDEIGIAYGSTRREDPRLAGVIMDALGDAESVVNVGAGAGAYEPRDRPVLAIEPSITMIRQRPPDSAPVAQAVAEALPLPDRCVAAALAVLTIHHWTSPDLGLSELCRVARDRVVILTFDPDATGFWLVEDYFPEFAVRDRQRCPGIASLTDRLRDARVTPVPIPHDCRDGFLGAYWRRPAAYLDPSVRASISSFAQCDDLSALDRLARDLESGAWEAKHGGVLNVDALDLGYRLVQGSPRGYCTNASSSSPTRRSTAAAPPLAGPERRGNAPRPSGRPTPRSRGAGP